MNKLLFSFVLSMASLLPLSAQYGNDWIDFEKTYYKFNVAEDGLYRIPASLLASAGLANVPGSAFRLYRMGTEIPVFTTTDGMFTAGDFIEFVGEQNRGELDRALFQDPDAQQLNPRYSMYTDTAVYFLTWADSGEGLRIAGVANDLSNPPAPEPYYMHHDAWVFSEKVVDPRNAFSGGGISYSRYQEGEGFATDNQTAFQLEIPASLVSAQGPDALIQVRLASSTYTAHQITALFNGDTLGLGTASLFHLYHMSKSVAANNIGGSQMLVISDAAVNGAFAVSNIDWEYPRQCDFTGRSQAAFGHEGDADPQYFELLNFDHGDADPVVTDRNAGVRLIAARNGNTVRFVLPAFEGKRGIVVTSQKDGVHFIDALTPRTFIDYANDNAGYIMISHPVLRTGSDVVGQYAQYRSSAGGGGYDVRIYSINDLYDQFGYGIRKHPQAIRNFTRMINDQWSSPQMVLIIGKAVSYPYSRTHGSSGEAHVLVPTFGQPGADHLLFTENGTSLPPFPVGRLPVSGQEQLQVYLSKLMEYDQVRDLPQSLDARGWTKQILHMGGGQDADQQSQILGLLNNMADKAINAPFGAHVETFSKSSTSSTGQSNSDRIVDILHEGTSVVKFFGHSSSSTLDFQINNAADWQNKGKYPVFSAMGCKAGDIHQDFLSLSEQFVFQPDAGTIAFVAGSGSQYLNALGDWGIDWYDTFGQGYETLTLGGSIHESLQSLNQFGAIYDVLLVEQQTLNGDPAIRFHAAPGPDYVWDPRSVRYEPELITTSQDSFTLHADLVNIGTNVSGTVTILVEQEFPDGVIEKIFKGPVEVQTFSTTVSFRIPVSAMSSGLNTFYLTIDPEGEIMELPVPDAEENNTLKDANGKEGFDIFILDNRARATRPLEFSIVTETYPELIASSTNAFVKGATFVIELDTTPAFDSPALLREFFSDFFGVIRWKPLYQFIPGKVYYWRVSTGNGDDRLWDTSSFLYQPGGQRGWNQSHYGQFQRDQLINLDFDYRNRLSFDTTYRNFWVQNKVDFDPELTDDPVVYINNTLRRDFFTFYKDYDAHVFVIAIDSFSSRLLQNPPGGAYGSVNPSSNTINVFPFNTSTQDGRSSLITFLEDVVTDGRYVIMYTYQRPGYMDYFPEAWSDDEQQIGKSIFGVIESQAPGSEIRSLDTIGSVPYLLFYRKNFNLIFEGIANQLEETISFDYNFISHANKGDMISTLIGPAKQWHRFEWVAGYSENPANDLIDAQLVALSATLTDSIVLDVTAVADTTLDFIPAGDYPFMYLKFHTADQPDLSPAVVEYWRVLYDGMPDLLINPGGGFVFEQDSLMFGQPMYLSTSVENVGEDLDEVVDVRFSITDAKNNTTTDNQQIPPLASGESVMVQLMRTALGAAGSQSILLEVNADRTVEESSYLNNTGIINFTVLADVRNPLLYVTFDGRHLADGDVVSAQPVIRAVLTDDNPFLLLDDPGMFSISLRYPDEFDFTAIDVHGADITFEPALPGQVNQAALIFRPTLEPGFYDIVIQAEDGSENDAGSVAYRVTFEVISEALLSRVDASPRWFNDHTRFTFTITGSQLPAEIALEIANAAGQIVRTMDEGEIGLFVGTTEYVWDGTTDSGEKLPAGVYFYRLDARDHQGREYSFLGRSSKDARVGKVVIIR